MAIINPNEFINEKGEKMVRLANGQVIPTRAFSKWLEMEICRLKGWIYNGSVNDGGVDAMTPKGRKIIQLKAYVNYNCSSFKLEMKFNNGDEAIAYENEHKREFCEWYAEHFNTLILYKGQYKGDKISLDNITEVNGFEKIVEWLMEHTTASYQGKKDSECYGQFKIKW